MKLNKSKEYWEKKIEREGDADVGAGSIQRMVRRPFPIMRGWTHRAEEHVSEIPWEMIAPHAVTAMRNHDQTLERLAQRGGLCPMEAVAVLQDMPYRERWPQTSIDRETATRLSTEANNILQEMVSAWMAS